MFWRPVPDTFLALPVIDPQAPEVPESNCCNVFFKKKCCKKYKKPGKERCKKCPKR